MTVIDYRVATAPRGNRRSTVSSQREFIAPLVDELHSSLASLRDATTASAAAQHEVERMAWLVAILGAVNAEPRGHKDSLDLRAVVRDAAAHVGLPAVVDAPEGPPYQADQERIRFAVEVAMESITGAEDASVRMFAPGLVVLEASLAVMDDDRRRWLMRTARRLLEAEGCTFRLRTSKAGLRLELSFF